MPEQHSARSTILDRINQAVGSPSTSSLQADGSAASAWDRLPRLYDAAERYSPEITLQLLADRLRDYDAHVHWPGRAEIAATVHRILAQSSATTAVARLLVPPGLPLQMLPAWNPVSVDQGFSPDDLNAFDCVLTLATLAIAKTGTMVLQSVPGQGRRAITLVPDTHICVVNAKDVVQSVPEAMRRLQRAATLPVTFVSGPSATADIEMTRIKGVHGPRTLHVLLIQDDKDQSGARAIPSGESIDSPPREIEC